MGGDHHHQPKVVVPDYKAYRLENCPELLNVQQKLAEKGLKSPWLRNDVWRFERKNWKGTGYNIRTMFLRGIPTGLVLFGLTLAYEAWAKPYEHHGHGHDSHH